jgi:hypothetical protein
MRPRTKTPHFLITTKSCAVAIAALTVIAISCWAAFLDGTKCIVTVTPTQTAPNKDEKEFSDTLGFADGKFSSAAFLAKGFKPAAYRGEEESTKAEFEVELTGPSNSVANWLGEIRGSNIMGRLTWKTADGTNHTFDFQGTKK